MTDNEPISSVNKGWRYKLGMGLFFGAFPVFFASPVVVSMLGSDFWDRIKRAFEWTAPVAPQ